MCNVASAALQNDIVGVESSVENSAIATVASVVEILDSSAAMDTDLAPNLESCLKNLVLV